MARTQEGYNHFAKRNPNWCKNSQKEENGMQANILYFYFQDTIEAFRGGGGGI